MAPPVPFRHLVRRQFRALERALPEMRRGDVEAVHRVRVSIRRLRELLLLLPEDRRGRKLERRLRRLARALGPVRELDVALGTLDELERTPRLAPARSRPRATGHLRRTLAEERCRRYGEMLREVDRWQPASLWKKAADALAAREHEGTRAIDAAVRRRLRRRGGRLRAALEDAASLYLPDRLHAVRVAVKKLRYAMEIARDSNQSAGAAGGALRRGIAARIQALGRVQHLLGRVHDLDVLIVRMRGMPRGSVSGGRRPSSALDDLVKDLEIECRRLHSRYLALRRTLAAICDAAERGKGGDRRVSAA